MQALLSAISSAHFPASAQRIFHGRGSLHPRCEQWALDVLASVWLLTSFRPATEDELARIGAAPAERWRQLVPDLQSQPLNWVYQCRHEGRSKTRLMAGSVPEPHEATENGARFRVDVLRGQNHGLFLDMGEGRRWVREHVAARPGIKVLNLFAYTCAFSVLALQAGAQQVLNVDMSQGALSIGKQNHALNGIVSGASFMAHDIFNSWGKIKRAGPYELIILDPPSYQKGSFVASKDYARLMRRLPELLAPGRPRPAVPERARAGHGLSAAADGRAGAAAAVS